MITGVDVLKFYRPEGGWYIMGDSYDGIEFIDCEPITLEEFNAGFVLAEQAKAETQAKRQALLDKLGITEEEARLLLGGN